MTLPILFHYFTVPVPYLPAYALQQKIHAWQLAQRRVSRTSHRDVILLLEHRPVYTTGRRQTEDETRSDLERLTAMGADFVQTKRGGETTYHGPGQLTVYPLLDLGQQKLSVRDYICVLQKSMESRLRNYHAVDLFDSEHTGVFTDANRKIGSIGVQVQHRLTMHGLAMNVTEEPKAWFDQVVACGMADVKASCIEDVSKYGRNDISVRREADAILDTLASKLNRDLERLIIPNSPESPPDPDPDVDVLLNLIRETQDLSVAHGDWLRRPQPKLP